MFFYTLCLNSDANIVPIKDSDEPVKKKKIRRKKQKTNAGEPSNIGIHFTICSSVLFCMCHLKKMTFFFPDVIQGNNSEREGSMPIEGTQIII